VGRGRAGSDCRESSDFLVHPCGESMYWKSAAGLLLSSPEMARATRSLDFILAALSVLIAVTTFWFPSVTGYGTQLFQLIAFTAWALVEKASSGRYADTHHVPVWATAAVLNVVVFWSVALPLWALSRRPFIGMVALMFFAALYIGSLFWLFPATDGP
jgi:hypothetical protein